MKKGTIVLTRFPFTDLSSSKRRPAVVISKTNKYDNDVIVAFISSVIPGKLSETDLVIYETDIAYKKTGLRKKSVFKLNKIATLEKTIFSGELGYVSEEILMKIEEKLIIALDLGSKTLFKK